MQSLSGKPKISLNSVFFQINLWNWCIILENHLKVYIICLLIKQNEYMHLKVAWNHIEVNNTEWTQ